MKFGCTCQSAHTETIDRLSWRTSKKKTEADFKIATGDKYQIKKSRTWSRTCTPRARPSLPCNWRIRKKDFLSGHQGKRKTFHFHRTRTFSHQFVRNMFKLKTLEEIELLHQTRAFHHFSVKERPSQTKQKRKQQQIEVWAKNSPQENSLNINGHKPLFLFTFPQRETSTFSN